MPTLRQIFLRHIAQTSPSPLAFEIERAEGMYLYDTSGKRYMDLIAGIGVSALGHRHERVMQAIERQLKRYLHTTVYGEFVLEPQVAFAERLSQHLPPSLSTVYYCNSGAEAVDGAMKLAKRATGRPHVIACRRAYHGSTQATTALMEPTTYSRGYFPLLPGVRHIDFNREESLERIDENTACVIIEPVQAEAGVRLPAEDEQGEGNFLQKVRQRCDETGALLVFDEVQTGFGRCGKLFALERFGVIPDILALAKGFGGGLPLGAFIASPELMKCLSNNPILGHLTTFGGHPLSCAAGLATLEVLLESELIEQAESKALRFRKQLSGLPQLREIRHAGLLMALEFDSPDHMQALTQHCLKNGLITDWFLFDEHSLRIAPPLIITETQIDEACAIIQDFAPEGSTS